MNTTTTEEIELQLIDVVLRHELEHVPLDVTDLTSWSAQRTWRAITTIWQRGERPTIWNVHDHLCTESSQTRHPCTLASDLIILPIGRRDLVDDYVAVITNNARRHRLSVMLADAAESVANGADPDAVLRRLQELVT